METFTWKVRPDMRAESEPRIKTVSFGDGYEQRRPDGINNDLKKYSIALSRKHVDAKEVEGFLARHGGVKAFLWTPPYQTQAIRVVCRKWSTSTRLIWTEFSAEFEQVVV